ncbi:hypothetical protein E8E14_009463 [Neopestalotiopsis sp. 37M]|nr:hypothetical protein E8E14_009463 [Neopestalotiopsis sp. 37M]
MAEQINFHLFPLLPRDIQLIIWDVYESCPGMRHKFTVGYSKITHTTVDVSQSRFISNIAVEGDPEEMRLDPFCKYKFNKIQLSNPDIDPASWTSDTRPEPEVVKYLKRIQEASLPARQSTSFVYVDLERDLLYLENIHDDPPTVLANKEWALIKDLPPSCWMPLGLSQARHLAIPIPTDISGPNFSVIRYTWPNFELYDQWPHLETVYLVVRPHAHRQEGQDIMKRAREMPRDAFGFVMLESFYEHALASKESNTIFLRQFRYWQHQLLHRFSRNFPVIWHKARVLAVFDTCFDATCSE